MTNRVELRQKLASLGRSILPPGYWYAANQGVYHLTYDDGPFPESTPLLLDVLKRNKIRATFFFTGVNCLRYPELVKRAAAEGHEIANHSTDHFPLFILPASWLEDQIERTSEIIEQVTGSRPRLFRAPYGIIDGRAAAAVKRSGMKIVYWGSLAGDWDNIGAGVCAEKTIAQMSRQSLLVLHETPKCPEQPADATRIILEHARENNLSFRPIKDDSI